MHPAFYFFFFNFWAKPSLQTKVILWLCIIRNLEACIWTLPKLWTQIEQEKNPKNQDLEKLRFVCFK